MLITLIEDDSYNGVAMRILNTGVDQAEFPVAPYY